MMTTTPPTTPPAIAPTGVDDLDEEEREVGVGVGVADRAITYNLHPVTYTLSYIYLP